MTGTTLTLDQTAFRRDLRRLERRAGALRPVLKEIGALVVTSVQTNFEEEGRPKRWRPNKASTLRSQYTAGNAARKRKRRAGGKAFARFAAGKKILQVSGRLKRSVHARTRRREVLVGTNLVYGAVHNFGGRAGRGKKTTIPQREFLLLQKDDEREIRAVLARFVSGD